MDSKDLTFVGSLGNTSLSRWTVGLKPLLPEYRRQLLKVCSRFLPACLSLGDLTALDTMSLETRSAVAGL